MTSVDFQSLEAQVRAEADHKVQVLREIVETHTALTNTRDEFLVADAERVRRLNTLVSEARSAGFDTKTLKPFTVEHLSASRPPAAKAGGTRRRRRTKKDEPQQVSTPTAVPDNHAAHRNPGEQFAAPADAADRTAISA
ncbi:hypothetical protein [Williamsia soli]|uniref:hypothetical protein n=1 Tax=Williamsia soli TaxID=364929 RepID=UPI001A9CC231|nr:hypothetical protein [Williamsia soli]